MLMHQTITGTSGILQHGSIDDWILLLARMRDVNGLYPEVETDLVSCSVRYTPGIFSAGLVGMLLGSLPATPCVVRLRRELAEALIAVQNGDGTWSFEGPSGRFPPDIDDTALALAATHCVRDARRDFSRVLDRLSFTPSGMARTWILPRPSRPNVTDVVVNLHLVASLRHAGLQSRPLAAAVLWSLRRGQALSPYYTSNIPLLFAFHEALPTSGLSRSLTEDLQTMLNGALSVMPGTASSRDVLRSASLFRRRRTEVYYTSAPVTITYALIERCRASCTSPEIAA